MATSSTGGGIRGFFIYYRVYARSGIHAASAAALTALIGLASFVNGWFVVLAIAVYVFPPLFLYLTAEGKNVPSIIGDENHDRGAAGADDKQRRMRDDTYGDIDRSRRSDASNIHSASVDSTSDTDAGGSETVDANADGSLSMSASGVSNTVAPPEEDMSTADDGGPEWIAVDVPIDKTLCAVATARDGVYAVGKHGVVLARHGGAWETVLERGPAAQSNTLRGMDTTSDGEIVWFAGDSGVLGRYDVESGRHTDHSAPNNETSTWADIAITGPVGEENIHLVNGSGEYLRGEFKDGEVDWGEPQKPGSGSSMTSIAFVDRDLGYICDTNQGVFETTDGGEHYEMIGIEDANTDFNDLTATAQVEVVIAGGDGSVFRYDGTVWTRLHAGENALRAIDLRDDKGLATGDDSAMYELTTGEWEPTETSIDADLLGVVIGSSNGDQQELLDVAVGANGTILERYQ